MSNITPLPVRSIDAGNATQNPQNRLYALVYPELKRIARANLSKAGPITLDPTALVHEAWLRCRDQAMPTSRLQFLAYAGAVMRSVIVDHVRERAALKRGSGFAKITLSTAAFEALPSPTDVCVINDALDALDRVSPALRELVEMRYFGGMTIEEISAHTGRSTATLTRDWRQARAFLLEQLREGTS